MTLIIKREIKETRDIKSPYKVDLKNRKEEDDVLVEITHKSDSSFKEQYLFKANQLQGKKSIHFSWDGKNVIWPSKLTISSKVTSNIEFTSQKSENIKEEVNKSKKDEYYVIDLCDMILKDKASRQHRFDFLCGDTGTKLPVDAYYQKLNLVVEYYEKQHTESVKLFNRMTVSGVSRDEQRRKYDERRKKVLPQHNINVVTISYSDFKYNSQKRIIRNEEEDLGIIRLKLKEYLK